MSANRFGEAALALALLVPLLGSTPTTGRVKVSGRHIMTVVQQQQTAVGDAPGHILLLLEAKGKNQNTGALPWMEQSTVFSSGTADLVAGNGVHQGYILEVENGDTSYVKWSGQVTTTLADGKTPITTFEGQWMKIGGSGRFSRVTGAGTYKGRFTSKAGYATDWVGEVDLPKGYTATR